MDFISNNMKHGRMQKNDSDLANINISLTQIDDKENGSVIGRSRA